MTARAALGWRQVNQTIDTMRAAHYVTSFNREDGLDKFAG